MTKRLRIEVLELSLGGSGDGAEGVANAPGMVCGFRSHTRLGQWRCDANVSRIVDLERVGYLGLVTGRNVQLPCENAELVFRRLWREPPVLYLDLL